MSSARDGKFRSSINLLCKYLGDFLIASYLDIIQDSGYNSGYVKEIEVHKFCFRSQVVRMVLMKILLLKYSGLFLFV